MTEADAPTVIVPFPCPEWEGVPEVGTIVRYTNWGGHPRAAIVTGQVFSLAGEQHCPLVSSHQHVHLQVFSPLPRAYAESNVPFDPDGGAQTWRWFQP